MAARAASLLGYAEDFAFRLADRDHRILQPDELVADGESYALVVEPKRSYALS